MAPNMDPNADVINSTATPEEQQAKMLNYLSSIESLLKNMASGNASQSAARDMNNNRTGESQKGAFSQQYDDFWRNAKSKRDVFGSKPKGGIMDDILDGIEDGLLEGVLGSDYKKRIANVMKNFSDEIGVSLKDLPGQLGKSLGRMAMDAFKSSKFGQGVTSKLSGLASKAASSAQSAAPRIASMLGTSGSAAGAAGAGGASAGLAALGPYALAAVAALIVLKRTIEAFGPAVEGTKKLFNELKKVGNRYIESRKENIKRETERLRQDVETIIKLPFQILQQSAEKVEQVWDNTLRKITATQGYSKADLQDLMSAFAERIRSEGLSSVVSAADVTDNLAKVLESGLAGPVAEEFAYIATKLNAAIPTQDFFGYASTYASIVANAIKNGQSQVDAVQTANQAIETYASSILYASRQLTGGVTTGLQNAQSLFEEAVKIVQASRTGDVNQVAGVLTSVSATIGAIAPDLASSITDVVVKAAIGGNASDLVALRSLAGINASNTEFLRQLATDPKSVFVAMFQNLGRMQNMSPGAYMEVAEGLSSVFGLSLDALSRVDFNYLAQSIAAMNVSNASLEENMDLLASGQTTLTAEQLRTQQINKYMLEEGLSMVLDNEAARAIQQHMWDEQMSRELMEATYSVELKGAALEFLEGIKETVHNIINILNPFAWIGKVVNMVSTANEVYAHQEDIAEILARGRVGHAALTGSDQQQLINLMTRGADLGLVPYLVELMGGTSSYGASKAALNGFNNLWYGVITAMDSSQGVWSPGLGNMSGRSWLSSGIASRYAWGSLRKSTASALFNALTGSGYGTVGSVVTTSTQSSVIDRLNRMLEPSVIEGFVKAGKGYDDWAATASQYGIRDLSAALDEAGYTQQQIESYFEQLQTQQGQQQQQALKQDEQDFRDKGRDFWISQLARMDLAIEDLDVTNSLLTAILDGQTDFYQSRFATWARSWDSFYTKWVNYFVENAYYNERTGLDYAQIRAEEHAESQGAIYALAEAFNQGVADISDPTVQTNALLSKILLVCSNIMQQNATKAGGSSLADTLNALALGITV